MPKLARTVLAFAVAFAIVAATVVGVDAAGYVVRSPSPPNTTSRWGRATTAMWGRSCASRRRCSGDKRHVISARTLPGGGGGRGGLTLMRKSTSPESTGIAHDGHVMMNGKLPGGCGSHCSRGVQRRQ
jgi:hypothetical protein